MRRRSRPTGAPPHVETFDRSSYPPGVTTAQAIDLWRAERREWASVHGWHAGAAARIHDERVTRRALTVIQTPPSERQ